MRKAIWPVSDLRGVPTHLRLGREEAMRSLLADGAESPQAALALLVAGERRAGERLTKRAILARRADGSIVEGQLTRRG